MAGEKKSWAEMKVVVGELRQQLAGLYTMVPNNISFRQLPHGRVRIYFLSNHINGGEVLLLYADVGPLDTSNGGSSGRLQLQPLLESNLPAMASVGRMSREEQLLWERRRQLPSWGITSYELHPGSGKIIFPAASNLFQCSDTGPSNGPLFPTEVRMSVSGAKLNPQICPTNPDLVAFVNHCDIFVTHTITGHTERLTYAHKNSQSILDDPLSAGIPSYVIQEEFCRYQGFWWQPVNSDGVYRIAYEEVDESDVKIFYFPSSLHNTGEIEEFRFPRAGTPNSKSSLKMLEFRVSNTLQIIERRELEMQTPLSMHFPWMEYLARVGWTPDGEFVWAQLLDRKQQHLELVLISAEYFVEVANCPSSPASFSPVSLPSPRSPVSPSTPHSPTTYSYTNHVNFMKNRPMVHTLCTQDSDVWINVNNLLYFLPQTDPNEIKFIWANEETGFRHLYFISAPLSGVANGVDETLDSPPGRLPPLSKKIALTCGDWEVLGDHLWVDVQRELVYFLGLRENALEKHLYVVSLRRPGEIRLLTRPGYSYTVDFSKDCKLLVTLYSNIQKLPTCEVCRISDRDMTVDGIQLTPVGYLMEPRMPEGEFYCPELYTHQISSGTNLFAMVFKPHNFQPGCKYPTVLHIYGGPEVQVVSNTFKGMRQLRLHMLAAQGYCVVAIDSRGSQHRGLQFEGHLRCKMGTVELSDQVEVLQWLADELGFIDMNRVAILGWSYGGYLSLMGLARYPHIFKVAVAGAPVTNWLLYDTGYTERYMDLPEHNEQGYKLGSVLTYVNQFPDEENRLLIIHGLIDENVHFLHTSQLISALVKAGKPYQLQVYPNERHSLRHMDASKHYETVLLSFLQNNL